jgi:hypothetical protein
MPCLTPGSFAVAARQKRLRGKPVDSQWLLGVLAQEMAHNRDFAPARPMGFVH